RHVLPELIRQGIGVLGMKSLGNGQILKSGCATPVECLHYAMSLPTSTIISGMDSLKILEQNLEAVRTFHPLDREELEQLLNRTRDAAARGEFEGFKTTNGFDATAQNPDWLGEPDAGP
ncbi:MAG TPA: hypothetical protein VHB77_04470, partial [Planctomycetaceae bacterium]|nr:hypothetical protein [Planctomycetaceae bacterium]